MKDLEKICEYKELCEKKKCKNKNYLNCKLFEYYIMLERIVKIREAEGLDYLYFVNGEELD